jgi:hypothetical protein
MEKIGAPAAKREAEKVRRELALQYRQQLAAKEAVLCKRAMKTAEAAARTEIATLQRKLQESERIAQRDADRAVKEAVRESRRELETAKERSEKEQAQYAEVTARLQKKIEDLAEKLKRQGPVETGENGEVEVYAALKSKFPTDDIQRIGKGVNGPDILQKVIVNGKEVGRIVYECKNVKTFQNEFVTQAKRYGLEYQTPWVIIAAKRLPRGEESFAVEKGVPVIRFGLTATLAEIVREAVKNIGQLRISQHDSQTKALEMFEYILSDHFVTRFKHFAEAIAELRERQNKEKQWHSGEWTKQARLFDAMDSQRREITAQIDAISEAPTKPVLKVVGGT